MSMNRRTFLTGTVGLTSGVSGCLGKAALETTDHETEFISEIEDRDVEVRGMEVDDDIVTVEYESENTNDDLADVAMAFVEQINAGWDVDRLDGIARQEPDLAWYAEAVWAREYLEGEITAGEYGDRINETLAPTVVIEGDEDRSANGSET